MIIDSFYITNSVLYSFAIAINLLLLSAFLLCPLKMNTSKYFIPITSVQNVVYSLACLLGMPRAVTWNFCWVVTITGPATSWALGMVLLQMVLLLFVLHLLATANIFFYRYLQLRRSKYFIFYSTVRGFFLLSAINFLIITDWAAYLYFTLWPSDDIGTYLKAPIWGIVRMDPTTTAFVAFCAKPDFKWSQLFFGINSLVIMSLLTGVGIYWAIQINITLRQSSLSNQTKAMHRRMNALLVMQTACPILFLHVPAISQHCMTYIGHTSSFAYTYAAHTLWALFPLFSPLITIIFLKEYRTWFLSKIGLRYTSNVFTMDTATVRINSITAQVLPYRRST